LFKLRGYLALTFVCLVLLLLDPVQRLVIGPWARLAPSRRIRVLTRWQRWLAHFVLRSLSTIGGAEIPALPAVPARGDTLVLMNHQSLLDIPLVIASVEGAYTRIVTRKRYLRWIPLISHMVRLYQYPVVDPSANAGTLRQMLASIRDAARTTEVPLAIFPEGTRTRNGEIGRFKTTGLALILEQKPWTVYLLVADGFWERAKMKDFLGGMAAIRGRIELLGPFEWSDAGADPAPFIREMREHMVRRLADMRAPVPAP
jgi:1-acyl-sn-glycerol-3-phosphate acyltransferase